METKEQKLESTVKLDRKFIDGPFKGLLFALINSGDPSTLSRFVTVQFYGGRKVELAYQDYMNYKEEKV